MRPATGKTVDIPHNLVVSWAYVLPIGPGQPFLSGGPAVVQKLLEGWTVNGITSYQSGEPINVFNLFNKVDFGTPGVGNQNDRFGSAALGRISTRRFQSREIQLGGRFLF